MPAPPSDTVLEYILQSSINVTASGNSGAGVGLPISPNGYTFNFDNTLANAAGGDTIAIKIQTGFDGVRWFDVCALNQITGTTGEAQYLMKIERAEDEPVSLLDDRFLSLVVNTNRHYFGRLWRVRWIVAGGTPSFTFSVRAIPI